MDDAERREAREGAEAAARAFLAALDEHDFERAASYVHPATAALHRDGELAVMLAFAEQFGTSGPPSGSYAIGIDHEVNREQLARFGDLPARGYRGASTIAGVAAFTPAEFVARTLENALAGPPGAWSVPRRFAYVGVVAETGSVAHALYREVGLDGKNAWRSAYDDEYRVQVLGVRRVDGRWLVVPDWMLLSRGSGRTMPAVEEDA